ncbi:MAG: hypothetical protein ACLQKA_20385 [Bryobacteraceae bacterium]
MALRDRVSRFLDTALHSLKRVETYWKMGAANSGTGALGPGATGA